MAASLKSVGRSVGDHLEEIARRYGLHVTEQWSGRIECGPVMKRLRADPPALLANRRVLRVIDLVGGSDELPASDVVILELEGDARVVVRPSGTEPKIKLYFEVVVPAGMAERAKAEIRELRDATGTLLGLPLGA
jgi:phosphomannomutase